MNLPHLLVAVVAHEQEEAAIRILREEGVDGVTALSGKGIGFPGHKTFFGLTYQGFETVLIGLAAAGMAKHVADRLNHELELMQPFQGLAFVLPLEEIGGVYSPSSDQTTDPS